MARTCTEQCVRQWHMAAGECPLPPPCARYSWLSLGPPRSGNMCNTFRIRGDNPTSKASNTKATATGMMGSTERGMPCTLLSSTTTHTNTRGSGFAPAVCNEPEANLTNLKINRRFCHCSVQRLCHYTDMHPQRAILPADNLTYTLPADNVTCTLPADNLTYTIPTDNRKRT